LIYQQAEAGLTYWFPMDGGPSSLEINELENATIELIKGVI